MSAVEHRYWSEAEFLERPTALAFAELVDGEVVVTPSPSWWHGGLCERLGHAFRLWADAQPHRWHVRHAPLDLHLGPDRVVQPDLALFQGDIPWDEPRPLRRLPRLVVEVASPSTADHDRRTKRLLYAAAGVPELWLVDPEGVVEVFTGAALGHREVEATRLAARTVPGLEVDLRALFDRG
ncbi:MAG: Uma2 family endonuclease [Alphaproteobacteria bacterium]|nr:Uma2 family endonuclease [Alphaproteobacteria bacterium]